MIALTFVVYWALPTRPAAFVYPDAPSLTDAQVAHADHLLGLDRPKIVQYGDYVSHLLRGDLGRQWAGTKLIGNNELSQRPIGTVLYPDLRITLSIILGGALLVLLLAVPLRRVRGQPRRLVERPDDLARRADRHLHAPDGRRAASSRARSGTCVTFRIAGYCPLVPGRGVVRRPRPTGRRI